MIETAMIVAICGLTLFTLGVMLPGIQLPIELHFCSPDDLEYPRTLPARVSINVIVPAYLESSALPNTISTLRRALDIYDGPGSITLVASDHDTAMAARSSGADIVIETAREGKPAAANRGVAVSTADIVVFTDANCEIVPIDWPAIVVHELTEWHMVSGNKAERGERESLFWRREQSTKRKFSASTGTISVVGEFMAMRRSDYIPMPSRAICDDLWLARALAREKKRVKVIDEIRTIEDPASNTEQWARRVRIVEGLFKEQVPSLRELMGSRVGRLFIGHKLYRVTIGTFGFWLMIASLTVAYPPTSLLVAPTVALVVAIYAGVIFPRAQISTMISTVGMQAVPLAGLWRVLHSAMRPARPSSPGWTKVAR